MDWINFHKLSEQLSSEAEMNRRGGNFSRSQELYKLAAQAEVKAVNAIDLNKKRTLGVTVVSAVALYYKVAAFAEAEQLAYRWLLMDSFPLFAAEQLRDLLQSLWSDLVRANSSKIFSNEVLFSIKGGEVLKGGAPLDLIVRKVEGIQALFYRTAEYMKGLPHRKQGPASSEILNICRPWLFQTPPGSYQFAVVIEEPRQQDLFPQEEPSNIDISKAFLKILRASVDDPDGALVQIVPDASYRNTFMKLTRNLAPSGQSFERLEIKYPHEHRPINIEATSKKIISESLRRQFPPKKNKNAREETITGVLRAVHLDEDWIEVTVGTEHIRITGAGEAVDDVVGPLVNRAVLVQVTQKANKKPTLIDIQAVVRCTPFPDQK